MRSDDELLSHIRQQAGVRRQRRQRVIAGAATAAVVLLLGAGALAANAGDPDESVHADDGGTTTTEPATTSTTAAPTDGTDTTTSTTETATTTTPPQTTASSTTEAAPDVTTTTTQPAAIDPVSETSVADGITLTVTATPDADAPGWVDFTIRIQAPHASHAQGSVNWGQMDDPEGPFGATGDDFPTDCDDLIDDDPTTNPGPDPGAGPVDETFTLRHEYFYGPGEVEVHVQGIVSFCTSDEARTTVQLMVPIG